MLTHHDARPYEQAEKEAKELFLKRVTSGKDKAQSIIKRVLSEVPDDRIVKAAKMGFEIRDRPQPADAKAPPAIADLMVKTPDGVVLHAVPHAIQQIAERAGIPRAYVDSLRNPKDTGTWGSELLADILNRHYSHQPDKRYLVRSYREECRAVLSDKFRRLDSRPLLQAFAEACRKVGAQPMEGFGNEVRTIVRAALPLIFEPVPGEVMIFGISWQNSDYGSGAHELKLFMERLWCTNMATIETAMRNVHLGKRLDENVEFSQKTYELDTATVASAIGDVVTSLLSPENTARICADIKASAEAKIDMDTAVRRLAEKFSKGLARDVVDIFNSPDVEKLPPGNTSWRLSNAVSLFAQGVEDVDRRLQLEAFAGELFTGPALKKAA